MISAFDEKDLMQIYEIINDSARAYKGIIPADLFREPYMTIGELREQIQDGVQFWCYVRQDTILGVMGIQNKHDVTLIRHAYMRSKYRNMGIGSELLMYLCKITALPILIGTWADATWAIRFYQRHGFKLVEGSERKNLLGKYWNISERQTDTSVVLTNIP